MDTDDTKRRDSNRKHISRCVEHSEKYLWNEFKAKKSEEHNTKCCCHTELDRLDHTFSILRTVVECNDRSDTVIQTEDRHEEKLCSLKYTPNTAVAVDENVIRIRFMEYVITEPIDCMIIDGIPIA